MENKAKSGFLLFNDVLPEESKILCSGGVLFSIFLTVVFMIHYLKRTFMFVKQLSSLMQCLLWKYYKGVINPILTLVLYIEKCIDLAYFILFLYI